MRTLPEPHFSNILSRCALQTPTGEAATSTLAWLAPTTPAEGPERDSNDALDGKQFIPSADLR